MVQARLFALGIQESHLKPQKISCFWVIVHVCLNLGVGLPSLKKVCGIIGKFFSVCSTQFELYLIQKWSFVLFRLAHNLSSKTGIFLHHDYSVLLFPLEDKKTQTLFSTEWKAPVAKMYHNIHFPCCYS